MNSFLINIEKLLQQTKKINRGDLTEANKLIKKYYIQKKFKTEGPCLICRKNIKYGTICNTHSRKGDVWLNLLLKKFKKSQNIEIKNNYKSDICINDYLFITISPYICLSCQDNLMITINKLKKEQENQYEKWYKEQTANEITTEQYIKEALAINKEWKDDLSTKEKINIIFNSNIDDNIIQKHILSMKYEDFLQTLYWQTISSHVKYKANYKCQLCGNNFALNVHHKNYNRHGLEHIYWREDLICLCQNCHGKFHNIKEEGE